MGVVSREAPLIVQRELSFKTVRVVNWWSRRQKLNPDTSTHTLKVRGRRDRARCNTLKMIGAFRRLARKQQQQHHRGEDLARRRAEAALQIQCAQVRFVCSFNFCFLSQRLFSFVSHSIDQSSPTNSWSHHYYHHKMQRKAWTRRVVDTRRWEKAYMAAHGPQGDVPNSSRDDGGVSVHGVSLIPSTDVSTPLGSSSEEAKTMGFASAPYFPSPHFLSPMPAEQRQLYQRAARVIQHHQV